MCMHLYRKSLFLPDLLFEDVHRCLVCFELLVLEENPPPQLQRRRQVRVVAEVTFKEEARHKTFPEHRLMDKCLNRTDETSINHQQSVIGPAIGPEWNVKWEEGGEERKIKSAFINTKQHCKQTSLWWHKMSRGTGLSGHERLFFIKPLRSQSPGRKHVGKFCWMKEIWYSMICHAHLCAKYKLKNKKKKGTVAAWRFEKQASGWKSASLNAHSSWENLGKCLSGVLLLLSKCSYKCHWGIHEVVLETRLLDGVGQFNSQNIQ